MNNDRRRKEYILNVILRGSIAMLVVLDVIVIYYSFRDGSSYKEISIGVFSLLPAFFVFLYVLSRRGHFDLVSYLMIGAYLASDSYAVYRWGVSMQVALLAYALIIVMATILRGARFGFVVTGIIAAYIIPLWYAQFNQIIPTQIQKLRAADGIVFAILYFLIMIVAWLYNREIERSLARAEASERDLKEERDLLEVNVERRTEELRAAQLEKVKHLKRLAELGQLSSGLFHDIINLLNAISLRGGDRDDLSLSHARETTRQIENFMHAVRKQIDQGSGEKESFSLKESIEHAIQLVSYKANKSRVRIVFERNGPERDGGFMYHNVPLKFHQVVINLLLNAIESYEDIPHHDARERAVKVALEQNEANNSIVFEVSDNGYGIAEAARGKIFEPFFTTKAKGEGIGIGLAMIKKIVEDDFHGAITVKSEEHEGTTFTITLPPSHERSSERATTHRIADTRGA